ncbi:hypothetical protein [Providencia sp. PROV255]|uniref:hypothetical protein n=1 Tax=Providencia sp. PROV255 TaxID=2949943 RepID=UPI00234979A9|nr:hypothetical protein [Providencia sp. PROV255]
MKGLGDISEVEKLKVFKAISVGCKDNAELREYISLFCDEDKVDEYLRRTQGYFNEDEFTVICYLLNTCKRITPLSQTPLPRHEKGTPDYLVTFKTKYGDLSCFIEVKSTTNHQTSALSYNAIERINNYGKDYGLPVLFASRIIIGDCGVWVLQTYKEFLENKRCAKISLQPKVIGNALMNDRLVSVITEFKMELTFKENATQPDGGPYYEEYGYLTGMNITADGVTISFDDVLLLDIIFSSFAKVEHVVKTSFGFKVHKKAKFGTSLPLSCLLLHLNTVLSDKDNVKSFANQSRLIAQIEHNNGLVFEQKLFDNLLSAIRGSFPPDNRVEIFGFIRIGDNEQIAKSNRKIKSEINRQKKIN